MHFILGRYCDPDCLWPLLLLLLVSPGPQLLLLLLLSLDVHTISCPDQTHKLLILRPNPVRDSRRPERPVSRESQLARVLHMHMHFFLCCQYRVR